MREKKREMYTMTDINRPWVPDLMDLWRNLKKCISELSPRRKMREVFTYWLSSPRVKGSLMGVNSGYTRMCVRHAHLTPGPWNSSGAGSQT